VTSATPVSYQQNHGRDFVPLAVVEVSDAGLGEVWNLSIDEVHEYVANGVLVCNCLRNAAMRFGAALDLWHKGDLHLDDDEPQKKTERPALPPYPDGNMAINLPDWRRHVLAGKNPADIISMIATKYALTDEQKRQIMALKPDTATGEIGDPMRVTFAQLAGRFAKARDMDMLDADADLIQYVEDAAQRGELKDMHKKRRAELGGGE
jgi:hypothetical protein